MKKALVGTIFGESEQGFLSCGPCAVLLKAQLIKNLPFKPDIKYMEDTIWNIQRLARSKCAAIVEETVYAYKINSYSATHKYEASVVNERVKALDALSNEVRDSDREWLALRVLANYFICCKCIMWEKDGASLANRLCRAKKLDGNPVWEVLRQNGISKNWNAKEKCKLRLAMSGALPLLISVKGAFK